MKHILVLVVLFGSQAFSSESSNDLGIIGQLAYVCMDKESFQEASTDEERITLFTNGQKIYLAESGDAYLTQVFGLYLTKGRFVTNSEQTTISFNAIWFGQHGGQAEKVNLMISNGCGEVEGKMSSEGDDTLEFICEKMGPCRK